MACEPPKPAAPPPPPLPFCDPPAPPPPPCIPPPPAPPEMQCPNVVSSKVQSEKPKAEVRRIEYDEGCAKSNKFGSQKKMGLETCCATPKPTKPPRLIMSPPPYPDLGKNARDVFGKGYHFGLIKLDVKTKSTSGVEFNTGGSSNQENGKVFGSLETKYKIKEHGLTFAEKWNTDNTLGTEVTVQDQLLKGLKLGAEFNFAPQSGNKSGALKSAFQNDNVALNADVKFPDSNTKPTINASAVVGYQGWLAGYQTAYDLENKKLSKNNFALGFSTGDFILHTNVDVDTEGSDDGNEFGGSIYQRVSPRLETGISLAWQSGSNNTKFGVGAKYDLDKDACVRAKVNNASQVGLGYQQRLRDGIVLTLSAMIDGKNFNSGGHKIGLALELEA